MKTLRRWWLNIKWMFNRPPTGITQNPPNTYFCDYCGAESHWQYGGIILFCFTCLKKTMDKVLKEKK